MNLAKIALCALILSCFFPRELPAKIRIISFHYNRPDFLELQYKTFQKFFLDDYEFIVMNDAPNDTYDEQIREFCKEHELRCVRFEPYWHTIDPLNYYLKKVVDAHEKNKFFHFPFSIEEGIDLEFVSQQCSVRHCHVIQYALDEFGYDHDDIVVIMDADAFPIKPMSIRELMTDSPLVGVEGGTFNGHRYLWVPFVAFDPRRLPNVKDLKFHVDVIDGVLFDTGSHSYHYLKNNPDLPYKYLPIRTDADFFPWDTDAFLHFGFTHPEITKSYWPGGLQFFADYHLVHYIGGSNLTQPIERQQVIFDLLKCVLED